jgi:phosphomannomutase
LSKVKRSAIVFGTDGWRAVIAEDFTFANLERVTQAYCDYLRGESGPGDVLVVVGYDCRFLSDKFAFRACEVLHANGLRVAGFAEPVPTPLVSWAVRENEAAGGIVITASHNPPEFNGFKIKAPWGGSASQEITSKVESLVDATSPSKSDCRPFDNQEALARSTTSYRKQIETYVDLDLLRSSEARVVIDSMHGSGAYWVESFLGGGVIVSDTIRGAREPLFGGVSPEPIDRNLHALRKRVLETQALVGLATDGDADRLGAVNDLGETMTMHEVVPLLLLHLVRNRGMTGGVVKTFSQSVLLKRIAAVHGLPLYETPIGFKYIAELMLNTDILIGAEESGGIGVKGHIPERDGILNCLLFLESVIASGKKPTAMVHEMHREFGEFYFDRRDSKVEVERGKAFVLGLAQSEPSYVAGYKVCSTETLDGTKLNFEDESWLLFRQSGTEPVLRMYSEATSKEKVRRLLDAGEELERERSR